MRFSKYFVIVAAAMLLTGTAVAGSDVVYVSNPDEGKIFKIIPGDGPSQDPVVYYEEDGSSYENMVVGPDGLLYACDPGNKKIIRIDGSGVSEVVYDDLGSPYAFQCGWFKNDGEFFVSDTAGSGVWSCGKVADIPFGDPVSCTLNPIYGLQSFNGQGITQAAIGDLLAVDQGGSVLSLTIDPYTGVFQGIGSELITNLDTPLGVSRSADGAIFVATADGLMQYGPDGSEIGECSEGFGKKDVPYFLDFAADDTLYVATISNKAGTLWEMATDDCDCDGSATPLPDCVASEVYAFTTKGDYEPSMVGVAVPFTEDPIQKLDFYGNQLFTFQDHAYELTAGTDTTTCDATITAFEVPPECLEGLIETVDFDPNDPDNAVVATPVLYNGDGGYGQIYSLAGESTCPPAEDGFYRHAISAYTEFLSNPRMIRCPDATIEELCGDTPPTCTVAELNSYFPYNGIFEGDGRIGSKVATFSEYFLVEVALATGTTPGKYCEFQSPFFNPDGYFPEDINDPYIVFDEDFLDGLPVFSNTETVPYKFKIAEITGYDADGNPIANCDSGPYVTNATVLMSIARVLEADYTPLHPFEPKPVYTAGSSAELDPALFNEADNPTKTYHFNGKYPFEDYPAGVYQIVLVPLTDNFGAQVRYFKIGAPE